jgi:hypothetical protein
MLGEDREDHIAVQSSQLNVAGCFDLHSVPVLAVRCSIVDVVRARDALEAQCSAIDH